MTDLQERIADVALDERIAWLSGVCLRESEGRPYLSHPWTVTLDGEPWTAATDGHRLVLLRGDFGQPVHASDEQGPPRLHTVLAGVGGEPHAVDLAALRVFIGVSGPDVPLADCAECSNSGRKKCGECDGAGEYETDCSRCGQTCDEDCDVCAGDGTVPCACDHSTDYWAAPMDRVRLYGDTFNRALLRYPLRHLAGASATWRQAGAEKPAMIDGGDWRFLVMPIRDAGLPADPFPA